MPGRVKGDLLVEGTTSYGELGVTYRIVFPGGQPDLVRYPGQGEEGLGGATVDGDLAIPRRWTATVTDPPGKGHQRVTLAFEVDPVWGVDITHVAVEFEEGASLREEEARTLHLGAYIDAAKAAVTKEADVKARQWREPPGGPVALGPWYGRKRPGRPPLSAETFKEVARLYQEAKTNGLPTAQHVSDNLDDHPSISATRRRIMLARQRGLIPPTGPTTKKEG